MLPSCSNVGENLKRVHQEGSVGMVATLRRAIALVLIVMVLGVTSCGGDRDVPVVLLAADDTATNAANPLTGGLSEVSPPERIQQLKPYLDVYAPQIRIASPDPDTTLTTTTVPVQLQVRDFPIYKDPSFGFGPHLHLFLDDQPHQVIYDADASVILEDLAPGTHTLRLLAVRPWGESFKNEGAYDQITFNVFAASPPNKPDDSKPVLTYNQPQGSYGAEPILLDFHLSNAPPHLVAQADETIDDWRIRCTVNGESFVFDRWQPIYLQGFKPGTNWVKLELIDESGSLIENALNTAIRVIDYQPEGQDSLSKLVRSEIPLAQAKVIIDSNYQPPVLTMEEPAEPTAPVTESAPVPTIDAPPAVPSAAESTTGSTAERAEASASAGDAFPTQTSAEPAVIPPTSDQSSAAEDRSEVDETTVPDNTVPATGQNSMEIEPLATDEDNSSEVVNQEPAERDRRQSSPELSPSSLDAESAEEAILPAESDRSGTTNPSPEVTTKDIETEEELDNATVEPNDVQKLPVVSSDETSDNAKEPSLAPSPGSGNIATEVDDLTESPLTPPLPAVDSPQAASPSAPRSPMETPDMAADNTDNADDLDVPDDLDDLEALNNPENTDSPVGTSSPKTDLKTLEDNADLI